MLDFNSSLHKAKRANDAINAAIDQGQCDQIREKKRNYLGASSLGHDCLRKIQWDWIDPVRPEPRTERIFTRGHWWEDYAVKLMHGAGFRMVRYYAGEERSPLAFSQLDGKFKGHGDGMIIAGPECEGVGYPNLWECKGLGSKGWTKLIKDPLHKVYPGYADQVALYQAYFKLTDHPAIFTAANLDTMELLHLLVPFDPERAQAASDRAVNIIHATAAGETMPKISASADDFRCRWCAHKGKCWP